MNLILSVLLFSVLAPGAFAVPPKQITVCGVYENWNSDGMMPVFIHDLLVELPSPMEGFAHYRLSAGEMNNPELEKRRKLLKSMTPGKKYCVTGPVSYKGEKLVILINKVKAW